MQCHRGQKRVSDLLELDFQAVVVGSKAEVPIIMSKQELQATRLSQLQVSDTESWLLSAHVILNFSIPETHILSPASLSSITQPFWLPWFFSACWLLLIPILGSSLSSSPIICPSLSGSPSTSPTALSILLAKFYWNSFHMPLTRLSLISAIKTFSSAIPRISHASVFTHLWIKLWVLGTKPRPAKAARALNLWPIFPTL